jgi:hypothetical protein
MIAVLNQFHPRLTLYDCLHNTHPSVIILSVLVLVLTCCTLQSLIVYTKQDPFCAHHMEDHFYI